MVLLTRSGIASSRLPPDIFNFSIPCSSVQFFLNWLEPSLEVAFVRYCWARFLTKAYYRERNGLSHSKQNGEEAAFLVGL